LLEVELTQIFMKFTLFLTRGVKETGPTSTGESRAGSSGIRDVAGASVSETTPLKQMAVFFLLMKSEWLNKPRGTFKAVHAPSPCYLSTDSSVILLQGRC